MGSPIFCNTLLSIYLQEELKTIQDALGDI